MNTVSPDLRRLAIDTIRQEHRSLVQVLELLRHLLRDIAAAHTAPEYHLLSLALYYIDDFPCRLHHPKEDQYLFTAIRRHTGEFDALLDELQADHARDDRAMRELYRLLVLYQAGAPRALDNLRAALDRYNDVLQGHMHKEETLLEAAADYVPDDEWRTIAEAFTADEDPLFGENRRREFSILHHRILNLLPRKMRALVGGPPPAAVE